MNQCSSLSIDSPGRGQNDVLGFVEPPKEKCCPVGIRKERAGVLAAHLNSVAPSLRRIRILFAAERRPTMKND